MANINLLKNNINSFMYKFFLGVSLVLFLTCINNKVSAAEIDYYQVISNEISKFNGNETEVDWITKAILYEANNYQVDPLLITALIEQESGFNMNAYSSAGAIGLTQVMPGTAEGLGYSDASSNPLSNIDAGVRYLKIQINTFAGYGQYAITYALAAYNAGPGAVEEYGGVPPFSETINYVQSVAGIFNKLDSMRA